MFSSDGVSFLFPRFNPYQTSFEKCRICKTSVHQPGSHYCQGKSTKYLNTLIIKRTYQWCLIGTPSTPWRNGRDKREVTCPQALTWISQWQTRHKGRNKHEVGMSTIHVRKAREGVCPSHSFMESMESQSNITGKFVWLLNSISPIPEWDGPNEILKVVSVTWLEEERSSLVGVKIAVERDNLTGWYS